MSNPIFTKEFEDYLITGDESSLQSLVPGSKEALYINIARRFLSEKYSPSLEKDFSSLKSTYPDYNLKRLEFLSIYKELKDCPEKKQETLKKLQQFFKLYPSKPIEKPIKYNKAKDPASSEDENVEKLPNSLNISEVVSFEQVKEGIYSGEFDPTDENMSKKFETSDFNYKLDLEKISDDLIYRIITTDYYRNGRKTILLNNLVYLPEGAFKAKFMKVLEKLKSASNDDKKSFSNLLIKNLDYFSNEQILFLIKECENKFISTLDYNLKTEIINRKFSEGFDSREEKQAKLSEMLSYIKKMNFKHENINRFLLYTILENDSYLNKFSLQTYKDYLELPLNENRSIYKFTEEQAKKMKFNSQFNNKLFCSNYIIVPSLQKEKELIETYLRHFFLIDNVSLENFTKYFETTFLQNIYQECRFLKGMEVKAEVLSASRLNELMKETRLVFSKFNKSEFKVDEDVIFELDIKNVQTLFVNVYEINSENYYLTKNCKFDQNINLEGIIPTYEEVHNFNEKPQILTHKKINVSKIPKQRGLYVIEMIGNGKSCRAVIQKGKLYTIGRETVNGKVFYILNEENKICKGKDTGIWLDQTFFDANENGAVLVPYKVYKTKSVIKHNGFCCFDNDFQISSRENYNLEALFILNEESFIMGNVATVLMRPYLTINGQKTSLQHLSKAKLEVELIKIENNQEIPVNSTFDNLNLTYEKEYEFSFQIPPKLQKVSFKLSGEVKSKLKDENFKLQCNKEYYFESIMDYIPLIKQSNNGNYIINILGKNGEIQKNFQVNFNFEIKNTYTTTQNIRLESDGYGQIDLGKLKDIRNINVWGGKTFKLTHMNNTYIEDLTILTGQEVKIPFCNINNFLLKKIVPGSNKIIENLTSKLIKTITDQKNNIGYLILKDLSEGDYILDFENNLVEFRIKVLEGKVWDNKEFLITKNKIILNHNIQPPISLENIAYDNNELKITLNQNSSSPMHPRVHLFAQQYFPDRFEETLNGFQETKFFKDSLLQPSVNIKSEKNIYLNNKTLSDEIQYVLDRKQYERQLGNTLEKPSLLLKPQYIRDTTTDINTGKKGTDFKDELRDEEMMALAKNCMRCMTTGMQNNSITKLNFIGVAPLIQGNLTPNDKGEIVLKGKLDEYSFIKVVCMDDVSCSEFVIPLKKGETAKRDLRCKNDMDYEKNYCEFRKVNHISKGKEFKIKDMTSINFKVFDSVEKYVEFLKLASPVLIDDLEKFNFLINFMNLTLESKLEKLSQFFSHEVNIYLYFHHSEFFEEYVKPIIKYKFEKTFIDFFLLDDREKIKEYTQTNMIDKLNTFEKCLLIYAIRKEEPELCKGIARQIRTNSPKTNERDLKRLFNIALNLKTQEEVKAEEEMMEEMPIKNMAKKKLCAVKKKGPIAYACIAPKMMLMRRCEMPEPEMEMFCSKAMKCSDDCCDLDAGYGSFDVAPEEAFRQIAKVKMFKEGGKSKEYCETQYYNQVFKNSDSSSIVKDSHFFADLAKYWADNTEQKKNIGFISENILFAPSNFTEAIFILSVLDLENKTPMKGQEYINDKEGMGLTIKANYNCYILTKEINESSLSNNEKNSIILAQITSEKDAVHNKDEDEDEEPKQFLTKRKYEMKTIVTNISNRQIICEVLIQLPEGAIPIGPNEEYSIIETASVSSYKSVVFRTDFYFPEPGTYKQYPASASINEMIIAKSPVKTYEVLEKLKLSRDQLKSMDDVLNQGSKKEILNFIKNNKNLNNSDLNQVYWMLQDKDFYTKLVEILKEKLVYDEKTWEYSVNHDDLTGIGELIMKRKNINILKEIGHEFNYDFIKVDETNNYNILNHLDYHPLINARVFKLPKAESILNKELRNTYQNYISHLVTLEKPTDVEYLRLTYYLILQQRIEEASKVFNKIKRENIMKKNSNYEMQYDYIEAYLDFSNGYPNFEKARKISEKYKKECIPIKTWRNMFNDISKKLDEYDNKKPENETEADKNEEKTEEDEYLSIEVKGKDISILYKNLENFKVKYYQIDTEILFSRSPFIKETKVDFDCVKPIYEKLYTVNKDKNEKKQDIEIPEELRNENLYLEVTSKNIKEVEMYYASLLQCSLMENIGEIKVMDKDLKPLPKVYVKCFCETKGGETKFYKDGFTDLRGKFNYIKLNNEMVKSIKRFSILAVSKEYGSLIKQCKPPTIISENKNDEN